MRLNLTRRHAHPSGSDTIENIASVELPDDSVVVGIIMEAVSKAMEYHNERYNFPPIKGK